MANTLCLTFLFSLKLITNNNRINDMVSMNAFSLLGQCLIKHILQVILSYWHIFLKWHTFYCPKLSHQGKFFLSLKNNICWNLLIIINFCKDRKTSQIWWNLSLMVSLKGRRKRFSDTLLVAVLKHQKCVTKGVSTVFEILFTPSWVSVTVILEVSAKLVWSDFYQNNDTSLICSSATP